MTISRSSLLLLGACTALGGCGARPANQTDASVAGNGAVWEVDGNGLRNQIHSVEQAERANATPSTDGGYAIPSPSDPGAHYRILSVRRLAGGHLEVLSQRAGSSGTSFARREIDCRAMTYRYLGEGDTRADAERDTPNPGPMTALTGTSASSDVATEACVRSE